MDKVALNDEPASGNFYKRYTKNIKSVFIIMFALTFTLLVYLPTDTFLNNQYDFDYPIQSFIFMMLAFTAVCTLLLSAIVALISTIIPKINQQYILSLFFGLNIAAYIQYLFMNGSLGELTGNESINDEATLWIMINMFICFIITFTPVILYKAKPEPVKKLNKYGSFFLLIMETLVILISLLVSGGKVFHSAKIYVDKSEQYVVSRNENIIVFVLDAVDNSYFKTILQDSPECFEGFEDYTLYTNTCSVFDSTYPSLSQMFTGMEIDNTLTAQELYYNTWHSDKANEFYERFHEANYKINAYNMSNIDMENEFGKFDNLKYYDQYDQADNKTKINRIKQLKQLTAIGFFRALPLCAKPFAQTIFYKNSDVLTNGIMYRDDEFYENLDISFSPDDKNYLIIQHLYGTHPPCLKGYIGESEYLLEMLNELNSQLKELGVYDDSTIIITSDHGEHNDENPWIAATPIFMIKEKNISRQEMAISSVPIYHEDIMSTLLVNAGLFNGENDMEMYGPSIYDFDENSIRSRTWYDRGNDPEYPPAYKSGSLAAWSGCNVYFKYTYTGDTETLIKMVGDREITETISMKENLG